MFDWLQDGEVTTAAAPIALTAAALNWRRVGVLSSLGICGGRLRDDTGRCRTFRARCGGCGAVAARGHDLEAARPRDADAAVVLLVPTDRAQADEQLADV